MFNDILKEKNDIPNNTLETKVKLLLLFGDYLS